MQANSILEARVFVSPSHGQLLASQTYSIYAHPPAWAGKQERHYTDLCSASLLRPWRRRLTVVRQSPSVSHPRPFRFPKVPKVAGHRSHGGMA